MFTGLVQELGTIEQVDRTNGGARLTVSAALAGQLREGESVAVNGVCLTATEVRDHTFFVDATRETIQRSTLGAIERGATVNLELPLRASDRLGGHIVQGHVDGVGEVVEVVQDGISRRLRIAAPPRLLAYLVEKGSVAVDGISLTVVEVDERSFTVSLIPETLERTGLGSAEPGTAVNLETDVLAKYVEKLLSSGAGGKADSQNAGPDGPAEVSSQ